MQLKTFRGPDTRSVMKQIKKELGPDAVILSTQTVRENGRSMCEATAALDASPGDQEFSSLGDKEFTGWKNWHQEWSRFKEQVLSILQPQINIECLTPRQRLVLEYLEKEGVSHDALFVIWEKFKNSPNSATFPLLSSLVRTSGLPGRQWRRRVHALTGPHGVGKTSTALRLAIREKNQGHGRICLANADTVQGKGRLYLRHYAELSGFDYRELNSINDWLRLQQDLDLFEQTFIDMPGLGKEQQLASWLENSGGGLLGEMCIHLCLSPLFRTEQIQSFCKKYHSGQLASIIWTKLDEACNYGALVDEGISSGLPVSGLSHGPGLKNSLSTARDDTLWKLILKHRFPDE